MPRALTSEKAQKRERYLYCDFGISFGLGGSSSGFTVWGVWGQLGSRVGSAEVPIFPSLVWNLEVFRDEASNTWNALRRGLTDLKKAPCLGFQLGFRVGMFPLTLAGRNC